jgi:glutamyl-tRNA synthetase
LAEKVFLLKKSLRKLFLIKERAHFVSEFWEMSDFCGSNYMKKPAKKLERRNSSINAELISVLRKRFHLLNIETIVKD